MKGEKKFSPRYSRAGAPALQSSADQVGKCIVFNIGGNKYRLIVIISPNWRKVYIRFVLTHKDYDRGGWKDDGAC
jgi:mRNA interferase HigB